LLRENKKRVAGDRQGENSTKDCNSKPGVTGSALSQGAYLYACSNSLTLKGWASALYLTRLLKGNYSYAKSANATNQGDAVSALAFQFGSESLWLKR
jgi:hypothetical protein